MYRRLVFAFVCFFSSWTYSEGSGLKPIYHWQNVQYVKFLGFDDQLRSLDPNCMERNKEMAENNREDCFYKIIDSNGNNLHRPSPAWIAKQTKSWNSSVRKAVSLLPEQLLLELTNQGSSPIKYAFYVDRSAWNSGFVKDGIIYFNLMPSQKKPGWMKWEALSENGFSEIEIMALTLHEIGHIFSPNGTKFKGISTYTEKREGIVVECPPTMYSNWGGQSEDDAESFMLYVMWSSFLKKFPERYKTRADNIKIEFQYNFSLPNSLATRLSTCVIG